LRLQVDTPCREVRPAARTKKMPGQIAGHFSPTFRVTLHRILGKAKARRKYSQRASM
jgi:hypothetical protein